MKRKPSLFVILCLLAIVTLPQSAASAPDTNYETFVKIQSTTSAVGSEIIISEVDFAETVPEIAYNPGRNEYLVAWQQMNASGIPGIYAQRVDISGNLAGQTPITIAQDGSNAQHHPTVAYDPVSDRYLIVWMREVSSQINALYAAFLSGDGNSLSQPPFPVVQSDDNHSLPKVAYGSQDENFMVAWSVDTGQGKGIGAQIIPADGSPISATDWITVAYTTGLDTRNYPDIAYNAPYNEFDIVYEKWDNTSHYTDIYASRVEADGTVVADCPGYGNNDPECSIWGFDAHELRPAIVTCAELDKTLIVWHNDDGSTIDVIGRLNSGANLSYAAYVSIANNPSLDEVNPNVACNFTGTEFMALWQEQSTLGHNLYARSVSGDSASPTSVTVQALAATPSYVMGARAGLAGGRTNFFAAWEQEQLTQDISDIHGRFVLPHALFMPVMLKTP